MNGDERFGNKRIENVNEMYGPKRREDSMRTFTLKRVAHIDDGTFGVLFDEEIPFCLTLEREWKDNQTNISCIPTGTYICRRTDSPKFGDTFEICDVLDRTHILFHKGNIEDDSHGCVVVGEQYHKYKSKVSIKASREGFAEFLYRTSHLNVFKLKIIDCDTDV